MPRLRRRPDPGRRLPALAQLAVLLVMVAGVWIAAVAVYVSTHPALFAALARRIEEPRP